MHPHSTNPPAAPPPEIPGKLAENPLPTALTVPAGKGRKRDLKQARLPFPRYSSRRPETARRPGRLFRTAPRTHSRRCNR